MTQVLSSQQKEQYEKEIADLRSMISKKKIYDSGKQAILPFLIFVTIIQKFILGVSGTIMLVLATIWICKFRIQTLPDVGLALSLWIFANLLAYAYLNAQALYFEAKKHFEQ